MVELIVLEDMTSLKILTVMEFMTSLRKVDKLLLSSVLTQLQWMSLGMLLLMVQQHLFHLLSTSGDKQRHRKNVD